MVLVQLFAIYLLHFRFESWCT